MATKDWAAPLVAAVVTFAGLLALPEGNPDSAPEHDQPQSTPDPLALRWAFADVRTPDKGITVLLAIRPQAPTSCVTVGPADGEAEVDVRMSGEGGSMTGIDCPGAGLARLTIDHGPGPLWMSADGLKIRSASDGPRLGEAGYNATRVIVHVFDEDGALIASNGNASEHARLGSGHSPQELPGGVWYLGANQTLPEGTQPLPAAAASLLPQLRGILAGLPVGGVATTQTDVLRALYGTLYVTAQVDELVHAP